MNVTIDDYQHAVGLFLSELTRLGGDVVSAMLYGSAAIGNIRPGKSDIDAVVVLRKEVFEDRDRFLNALETLVSASERLAQSGLPFQAPHHFSEDELNSIHPQFVPHWRAEETCKVVLGRDIRSSIAGTEAGHFLAGTLFFEERRILLSLSIFLNKDPLTDEDCGVILQGLLMLSKVLPLATCNALGSWPNTTDAIGVLEKSLPGIDLRIFERIRSLDPSGDRPDADELRSVILDVLSLMEALNDRIMDLSRGDEVHFKCGAPFSADG
jgi:predicted nucleotidyltransferase